MNAFVITSFIIVVTVIFLYCLIIDCFHTEYIDEILIDDYELDNNYEYDDYLEE